jgi:hypothetical protein
MIVRRSMVLQPHVTCAACGREYIGYEDDEVCTCGAVLPGFEFVGMIDAQLETTSGRRLLVRAARHHDGRWLPIAVAHYRQREAHYEVS